MSTISAQRELLGRFLRLAEFSGTTPYEDLYRTAGGKEAQRESFMHAIVRRGYIEIQGDSTVSLTPRGRDESRRMMQAKGL